MKIANMSPLQGHCGEFLSQIGASPYPLISAPYRGDGISLCSGFILAASMVGHIKQ